MAFSSSPGVAKSKHGFMLLSLISLLLVITLGVLGFNFINQADTISKYELLEKIDNQACRYLRNQPGVNGSFDLNVDAKTDQPKLTYTCLTGEMVASREVQGKFVGGYGHGATVTYFSSNEEAEKYAAEKLNPLRYWGVDEAGQQNGISQTSKFTFVVNDETIPYFDAYTVKANAVLRVSLPCTDPDVVNGGVSCYVEAQVLLDNELKGINVL